MSSIYYTFDLPQIMQNNMDNYDLHERFVYYLQTNYPNKRELVTLLADILKIERESVSRRLNGKVLFTVKEIGSITRQLNISLDRLLDQQSRLSFLPLTTINPYSVSSMDAFYDRTILYKDKLKMISNQSPAVGQIFDALPIEFFSTYSNLCRFIYYKWAHFFLKASYETDFTKWEIPDKIKACHVELLDMFNDFKSVFYIWNKPVIWNLMGEINYFQSIRLLKTQDVTVLKSELHALLERVEEFARINNTMQYTDAALYVSSINIGASCTYFSTPNESLIYYRTPFLMSTLYEDADTFHMIYEWINSMKEISTLVSGSGEKERRIFFDEQHRIVDLVL